ncbi:insulinase family protein [Micromonospora sp. NPDC023888]|uniref:M16 family metallopeptidase n=1 Tax=Micromonospora sp. NPDC023888 TaxID=3155607 RepID=UPI00340BE801
MTIPVPPLRAQVRVDLPPLASCTLPNGLRVCVAHTPWSPTVELALALPTRAVAARVATVAVIGDVVVRRTDCRDGAGLAALLGRYGAAVRGAGDGTWCDLHASLAADDLPLVLGLVAEMVRSAPPDADAVGASVRRVRAAVSPLRAQPQIAVRQLLRQRLYGPDAPALVPSDEAYRAVTATEVAELWPVVVQPGLGCLVVAGPQDPDLVLAEVRRHFADWRAHPSPPVVGHQPTGARGVQVVVTPTSAQASLVLAAPAVSHDDPRHPALLLANCLFGGYFSARLSRVLREREGLVYRVDALLDEHVGDQWITLSADAPGAAVPLVLASLRGQLAGLASRPPRAAEVDAAREFMVGRSLIQLGTQAGIVAELRSALIRGHTPDRLSIMPAALREVSTAEVRAVAADLFDPDRFCGVVAGALDPRDNRGHPVGPPAPNAW